MRRCLRPGKGEKTLKNVDIAPIYSLCEMSIDVIKDLFIKYQIKQSHADTQYFIHSIIYTLDL